MKIKCGYEESSEFYISYSHDNTVLLGLVSLFPVTWRAYICFFLICLVQEEFLKDVMQFLLLRGHNRLIPQGGLTEFPDAILNGKRLDLYNLYKEVIEIP